MQTICLSRPLPVPPERLWALLQRPATMQHVCHPLIRFRPLDPPAFPATWDEREYRVALRLFCVLPLGWQVIGVAFPASTAPPYVLRDRGHSPLMRQWDHQILVTLTESGVTYTDQLRYDAGWATRPLRPLLRAFFAHRQRRLARLVQREGSCGPVAASQSPRPPV